MKRFIVSLALLCLVTLTVDAGQRNPYKKPVHENSRILKVIYDGECVNILFTAFGTHYDQWQISAWGRYKNEPGEFGTNGRYRIPKGQTKEGIKAYLCTRSVAKHKDFRKVRVNAVLMKNGTIVDRRCTYRGGPAWAGCR